MLTRARCPHIYNVGYYKITVEELSTFLIFIGFRMQKAVKYLLAFYPTIFNTYLKFYRYMKPILH